ncbi:integrase core domain-containing protein [Luteipulveratus mongoliensis]|uniref:integrase core domain-containing protein n=1 Tax=Luteipulveratus mongoliensis TaxID=571913 RepID=UPI0014703841|nr:integrase core domain-containing protein [Luteipulveratus mongoliensis]
MAAFCAQQGLSRKSFYKYLARFAASGVSGFYPDSRRPHACPTAVSSVVEDLIVLARKRLEDQGWDAGANSIVYWLLDHPAEWPVTMHGVPSRSTINRVLKRRGLLVLVPRRAPSRHRRRFEAAHPNTRWQMDGFEYTLASGAIVVVLHLVDDCSRMDLACHAARSENSQDVWAAFAGAVQRYGLPAQLLTDNGTAFSGRRRGWTSTLETNANVLGVHHFTSSVGHPQTCGKVERAHQTCLKWLRKRPPAQDLAQLQDLLDRYREHYNHRRRHQHLDGLTPAQRYELGPKDQPGPATTAPVYVTRRIVAKNGSIGIEGVLVGVSKKVASQEVLVIHRGRHLAIFIGNNLIREITLTVAKGGYQRIAKASPKS